MGAESYTDEILAKPFLKQICLVSVGWRAVVIEILVPSVTGTYLGDSYKPQLLYLIKGWRLPSCPLYALRFHDFCGESRDMKWILSQVLFLC